MTTAKAKAWYKSKTIIFGALVALIGALEQFTEVLTSTDGVHPLVVSVIGFVVVALRFITKDSIK